MCGLFTGPNSSDTTDNTDSHDELQRGLAIGDICEHNGLTEEQRAHSATPNHASASSESSSHLSGSEASGGLEYSSALEDTQDPDIVLHKSVSVSTHTSSVTTTMGNRVPQNGVSFSKLNLNPDSNEASDTDKVAIPPQSSSGLRIPWSNKTKKFDSDFSTAPLSSETSDMDTSGHEKVCSDGGSTGDLTAISQDSRSDDLIPSSHSASASRGIRPSGGGKKKRDGRTLPPNYAIRKKEAGTTASPPPKRQLQASLSTPLKTNGQALPKQQVATVVSDSNGRVTSKAPHRPKPPIAAKPAKPEVKPKPPAGSKGGTQSQQNHQHTNCSSDVEAVDFASEHTNVPSNTRSRSELAIPHIGSPKAPQKCLRKVSSESNVIKGVSSSPFVPNKLSNVCEESEGKKENRLSKAQSPRPTRFSPRPQLLPTKPKPPVTVSRRVSPTPQPKPKTSPKSPPAQRKIFSIDDPASSETASSLPSSPFMTKRKPVPAQKPSVPLKRPGLFHPSASSAAILVPSSGECGSNSASPLVNRKFSSNGEGESGPPAKPYTKRREALQVGQPQSSPTVTPSVSPTPHQLPPRSPVLRRGDGELGGSPRTALVQPASQTASSSSQEEAPPPVPHRKGERKSIALSEAVAKMSGLSPSTESSSQTPPPVLRNLKPAQREETPSTGKKLKTLRRPPPTPPLSPSPPPLPVLAKTITRSTSSITAARTADPASPKRHSLFINPPLSEDDVPQTNSNRSEKKKEFEKLYQQSVIANSTAETPKKSDSESSESSTPTVHRKPHRHHTHYELTFIDSEKPPVLLKCASEASCIGLPKSSDSVPPPLPSQPIPSKKGRHQLLKRGPIRARDSTSPPSQKSDEGNNSGSSENSTRIRPTLSKNRIYDEISDMPAEKSEKSKKSKSPGFFSKLTRNDSKESVSTKATGRAESPFRREAKSFSSIMLRRSNSDRFKNKLSLVPTGNAFVAAKTAVHRTPSVDKLDDRMERSVRMSAAKEEGESSSDDEETAVSPTQQGTCTGRLNITCTCAKHTQWQNMYTIRIYMHMYICAEKPNSRTHVQNQQLCVCNCVL